MKGLLSKKLDLLNNEEFRVRGLLKIWKTIEYLENAISLEIITYLLLHLKSRQESKKTDDEVLHDAISFTEKDVVANTRISFLTYENKFLQVLYEESTLNELDLILNSNTMIQYYEEETKSENFEQIFINETNGYKIVEVMKQKGGIKQFLDTYLKSAKFYKHIKGVCNHFLRIFINTSEMIFDESNKEDKAIVFYFLTFKYFYLISFSITNAGFSSQLFTNLII
jgi:hypothetical protein